MVKIYIDPGHGGKDSGTVGNGLKEKDLTLKITKRIRELLARYKNVSTKMSRTGDTYPSLPARTNEAIAWGTDFFCSSILMLVMDKVMKIIFFHSPAKLQKTYQDNIHAEILKLVDFKDRGQKTGNSHVLRESIMV